MISIKLVSVISLGLLGIIVVVYGQPLTQLKFDVANIDTENVRCDRKDIDVIDECGLQQGNSYRFSEFEYPLNHSALLHSCKRQQEALKCLRAYAKCLPAMPKQVLLAMATSRNKYLKRVCAEKQTESAGKLLEMSKCMADNKAARDKGLHAEIASITIPETIVGAKFDSVQERIKQSCCSVAEVRQQYMESILPSCKQHSQAASEVIDSYLADTVGIVCTNLEKIQKDCEKMPKLSHNTTPKHKFFVKPILDVVQTLNA